MNTTVPQWVREFGTEYAVPNIIANDPDITDQSWHNDAMPMFCLTRDADRQADEVRRLSADHPEPNMREIEGEQRFCVWDGENLLYSGDDAAAAVAVLKGSDDAARNLTAHETECDLRYGGPKCTCDAGYEADGGPVCPVCQSGNRYPANTVIYDGDTWEHCASCGRPANTNKGNE